MKPPAWWPKAALVAVALGGAYLAGRTSAPPRYAEVTLPDVSILKSRPSARLGVLERIVTRTVKPAEVAHSAGTPEKARVATYCEAVVLPGHAPIVVDHDKSRDANDLTQNTPEKQGVSSTSLFPPFAGSFKGKTLTLHATKSDGSLWRGTYSVRPPMEWAVSDNLDTVAVHAPRRLLGVLALDPGVFGQARWLPTAQEFRGEVGLSLGDESFQVQAGTTEHLEPFIGGRITR